MSESEMFSKRVVTHSHKLFAVALRYLQQPEEAEDAVQDIYARLWEMRHKLPPDDELLPYMLVMTRNLCIDRLRAKERSIDNDNVDLFRACSRGTEWNNVNRIDTNDNTNDSIDQRDRLRQLMKLINQLPDNQRRVLKLKALDDLDNNQIERLTGLKQGNIRQLLARARTKITELANKQGLL